MNISINGSPVDVTLEKEKTLGDVLVDLEGWLQGSGHYVSGITIDGEKANALSFSDLVDRDLPGIKNIDVFTSSWADLAAEALLDTRADAEDYEKMEFGERALFGEKWARSPQARHLEANFPDLFKTARAVFSGMGLRPVEFHSLIDERIREMKDPMEELASLSQITAGIAGRLEDLPLDLQTGKDGRASETVQVFSGLMEKILRLFGLLRAEGFDLSHLTVDAMPVYNYIDEFRAALKEFLAACESKDVVLAGDLAEYELAPRLRNLYQAINTPA
jgi:hypothetical protein